MDQEEVAPDRLASMETVMDTSQEFDEAWNSRGKSSGIGLQRARPLV